MGEIFREQREQHDYLSEPEISEVALRETIVQIFNSGLTPEDQEALVGEAKTESLRFGLSYEMADSIHAKTVTGLAVEHLNSDLLNIVHEIKENQKKGEK
jgi:hypothetical protein